MSSTELNEDTVKVEVEPLLACRICLCWDVKLYDIHELGLNEMYSDLSGITLSAWDGLPQHICLWCRAVLLKAHGLRMRAQRADTLLKQALHHQQFITNSFIRTVDRSTYKLTHTLSTQTFNNDATYYFKYITETPEEFTANASENKQNATENNEKVFDINDDVKDDSYSDFSSELDIVNYKLVQNIDDKFIAKVCNQDATISMDKVEAVESLDLHIKRVKTKKRKLTRKNNGKSKLQKKFKQIEIVKTPTETVRNRRKREEKKLKDIRKENSRKKFSTEEDFREFEKKYNFQVQSLTEEEMEKEMERRKESDKYLKGEYRCELCYKGFLTAITYENHMKTHDPARGEHACRLCHLRYQFPVKLRQHVQNAHRLKFRCAKCNEVVRGKACAVLHAAYHAGTTFQCAHCDKKFLKKTSRTSHMRMAHPAENAAGGTCELCGETFTSRTGLKAHKTRSHKKLNLPELKCRKCRIQFDNIEALKRHKEIYADTKCDSSLSACEQCGESCASADSLIQHRHEKHAVQLFTCDTCTKSFTSKASLATHTDRVHRRIRPPKADYSDGGRRQPDWLHWASVCEHCGKRLSCLATLKIHMNKHTGERPYKCALCPKAYMTPYGLNNHQAFHTGVRKWQCPDCPATFMHQSSVYQHRKIHTGERSHQCTICDKCFTQSGSLYTHVKYVHMKETPPPRKRNKKQYSP